jgi:hypothetical protein
LGSSSLLVACATTLLSLLTCEKEREKQSFGTTSEYPQGWAGS